MATTAREVQVNITMTSEAMRNLHTMFDQMREAITEVFAKEMGRTMKSLAQALSQSRPIVFDVAGGPVGIVRPVADEVHDMGTGARFARVFEEIA